VSWLFDDFEAPAITNYQAFIDYGGMAELSRFFVKRGNEYAVSQAVPISTITALAFAFMGEGKTEEGISLLLENVANYRDPSRIYGALGFLYEQESAKEKALLAYQQALKFAVGNKQNSESQRYYENKVAQLGVE
jgi:tetratricopeptide (TPR) repeat protein